MSSFAQRMISGLLEAAEIFYSAETDSVLTANIQSSI